MHHGVRIKDSALVAAATLSNRYINERFLPDKAIDLVDEAAAKLRTEIDSMPTELDESRRRMLQLQIEEQANRIIWQNVPVEVSYPDSETLKDISYRSKKELQGQVRIVAIPQADVCACCGTHVRRTGELGLIKLCSLINRKSGVRIEMASGMRAYRYIKAMQEENTRVSHLFSAKPLETGAAAERVQNELNDVKLKLRGFQKEQLRALYEAQPENEKLAVLAMDGLDMNDLRAYCNDLIAQKHAGTACGLSLHGDRYTYVMISETVNLRDHAKTLNALLDGKGGGNSGMIQGSFGKGREEILKALKEEFDHD